MSCEHAKTCGDCWTMQAMERERERAEKAEARVAELGALVWLIDKWTHSFGAELCPPAADTYGEGVRDSKARVAKMLERFHTADSVSEDQAIAVRDASGTVVGPALMGAGRRCAVARCIKPLPHTDHRDEDGLALPRPHEKWPPVERPESTPKSDTQFAQAPTITTEPRTSEARCPVCDCYQREKCVRDGCAKCCYCGREMPETRPNEAPTAESLLRELLATGASFSFASDQFLAVWKRARAFMAAQRPQEATCTVCGEEQAAVCWACQKRHLDEAVDHYIDDKGHAHCLGCIRSGGRNCAGAPRLDYPLHDGTRRALEKAFREGYNFGYSDGKDPNKVWSADGAIGHWTLARGDVPRTDSATTKDNK